MQIGCCEAVELSCVVWSGRKDPAEGWWDCPAGPVMGSESWVYVTQTPVAFQPEIPGNQSGKPSSQHLTSSKSLSVVRLWGFKAEGGFISQTGEVSGEVPMAVGSYEGC